MKTLFLLALGFTAAPALAEVNIQDLTIVAEEGVSPEELREAMIVAQANITYPQSIISGNSPNVYTRSSNPFSITAGSNPNVLNRGSFPDAYTIGHFGVGGDDVAIPMPNTNL